MVRDEVAHRPRAAVLWVDVDDNEPALDARAYRDVRGRPSPPPTLHGFAIRARGVQPSCDAGVLAGRCAVGLATRTSARTDRSSRSKDSRPANAFAAALLGLLMAASAGGLASLDHAERPASPTAAAATTTTAAPTPTTPTGSTPPVLQVLSIRPTSHDTQYKRVKFGQGWIDADHNCRDTRAEVLLQQSTEPVKYRPPKECVADSGLWIDPWSGKSTTVAKDLDIDHTVPLANAWRSGAWNWTMTRRVAYANDLDDEGHLLAILLGENRSKGDQGPEGWKPPDPDTWCRYAITWDRIKYKWNLTVTQAEWDALVEMANTC
jgi:hypothetical protein